MNLKMKTLSFLLHFFSFLFLFISLILLFLSRNQTMYSIWSLSLTRVWNQILNQWFHSSLSKSIDSIYKHLFLTRSVIIVFSVMFKFPWHLCLAKHVWYAVPISRLLWTLYWIVCCYCISGLHFSLIRTDIWEKFSRFLFLFCFVLFCFVKTKFWHIGFDGNSWVLLLDFK